MKLSSYLKSVFSIKNITLFSLTFLTLSYFYFSDYDWKNKILNAVTPITGYLSTNTTSGVTTSATAVTSLISGGFVQGVNALFNTNANSYIAWAWKEDVDSGFEHQAFTTSVAADVTLSHSLGEAPAFILVKNTSRASIGGGPTYWMAYHQNVSINTRLIYGTTDAVAANTPQYQIFTASPTASTVTFSRFATRLMGDTGNDAAIAYMWAEKAGYSKFGSYTGNGSADGSFVYTGFKPRYLMIKRTDAADNWRVLDTSRNTYNPVKATLWPDVSSLEANLATGLDILSNGFKLRDTNVGVNASGGNYIYAAFAETPFKESGTAYDTTIASSTRFNNTNQWLSKTFGSAGNTKTWSYSTWVKRSGISKTTSASGCAQTGVAFFGVRPAASQNVCFQFANDDTIDLYQDTTYTFHLKTTPVYRDPSKWYHIVVAHDSTQATASNRLKLYVDGVQVTSFTTANYPALNSDSHVAGANYHSVGADYLWTHPGLGHSYFDGYIADAYLIDGQALAPTSFGEFDTNGIWKPKAYSGTYGTNGFHLDFSDPANPGNDVGKGGVTISSLAFQPDLVWIKATSSALDHAIFDSSQGVGKYLSSNLTSAVTSLATTLKSFTSTGFTLGSAAIVNTLNDNYVAWNWKESTTSGFDIVSYTGNGSNVARSVGHNLGVAPSFVITKPLEINVTGTDNWLVWHKSFSAGDYLVLNSTAAKVNSPNYFGNTVPDASNFYVGGFTNNVHNESGKNYIAYVFAEKTGFSKFGTYTGNGSSDGTFVYTGFKPRYVMIKRTDAVEGWYVYDTERTPDNEVRINLRAEATTIDNTGAGYVDLLSNGFKMRRADTGSNANGSNYIYAAFAEYPFKESGTPYNLTVASSTRFNGTNAYLDKNLVAPTNARLFTYSMWVKRSSLSATLQTLLHSNNGSNGSNIYFDSNHTLVISESGATGMNLITSQVFRDPGAWEHLVFTFDTTQATAADRVKIYRNGIQITAFGTASYPALNGTPRFNTSGPNVFGYNTLTSNNPFSGYMSNLHFVDGQALTPTSFGEYDTNGIWKPKTYAGAYGTNGFHLNMANAADPGNDVSGNNNDFTNNNIATTDNVLDSPTNNFPTLNSINTWTPASLSKGNLNYTVANGADGGLSVAGEEMTSGKWYWEILTNGTTVSHELGIVSDRQTPSGDLSFSSLEAYTWFTDGRKSHASAASAYGSSAETISDVIMMAFDADSGKWWVGKNGTWFTSGDPAAGTNAGYTGIDVSTRKWFPAIWRGSSQADMIMNFGQGGQSGLTYDGASGGYFKYTPPAGFKALSTGNLPASAVTKSNDYFDVVTYTGTGSGNGFTNNNILTTDNVIDTPTNNFTVLNALDKATTITAASGNLNYSTSAASEIRSSVFMTTGKWYTEFTATTVSGALSVGVENATGALTDNPGVSDSNGWGYISGTGLKWNNTSSAFGATYTTNDVIGVAVDIDAGKIWWSKNGVWQASGDPATGANAAFSNIPTTGVSFAAGGNGGGAVSGTFNFGQGGQAGLTYDPASAGYFKYTPPAGFKAISTANLPASDITKPNDYFDAQTYTGTGAAATRSLFNFEPALLWLKDRTSANNHGIFSTFTTGVVSASLQMFFEI